MCHLLIRFTPRPSAFAKTVATGLRRPVALLGPSPEPARPLARPSVCGRPGTPRGCLSAFHAEWSQPDKHYARYALLLAPEIPNEIVRLSNAAVPNLLDIPAYKHITLVRFRDGGNTAEWINGDPFSKK